MPLTDGFTATGQDRRRVPGPRRRRARRRPRRIDVGFVVGHDPQQDDRVPAASSWPAATDDLTGIGATARRSAAWTARHGSRRSLRTTTRHDRPRRSPSDATTRSASAPATAPGNWGAYVVRPVLRRRALPGDLVAREVTPARGVTSTSSGVVRRQDPLGAPAPARRVTISSPAEAFAIVGPARVRRAARPRLYIDGVYVGTIDLHRTASKSRVVRGDQDLDASSASTRSSSWWSAAARTRASTSTPWCYALGAARLGATVRSSAAPVGRHRVRRQQQRHVVAARRRR